MWTLHDVLNKYKYPIIRKCHIGHEEVLKYSDDPQQLIDPLWFSVSTCDGIEKYNEDLKRFSLPQRNVFAVMWYIAEVENGGHDQFFLNSTGMVWRDALAGLKAIGNEDAVKILEEAAERMGGNPSFDWDERNKILVEEEPDFNDLDEAFYKLYLYPQISAYILDNEEKFYFDGKIKISR